MTMQLLTPDAVKKTAAKGEEEARLRLRDMALEEERLVKSINDLHKDEDDTKAHYAAKVAKFRVDAEDEMRQIELEVAPKRAERAELMKPIDELKAQAEIRDRASQERETAVGSRETAADQLEKELDEREATFLATSADRKQEQDERQEDLDRREELARAEEESLKRSLDALNARWADFHKAIAEKEADMARREASVSAGDEANRSRATELNRRAAEQSEKERQLTDRYATLERSIARLEGRNPTI